MKISETGDIIPTELMPLYFDHNQDDLNEAFGIGKKRKRELLRELEDLFDSVEDSKTPKYDKLSQKLEVVLNTVAKNEQERAYLAFHMGAAKGKSTDIHVVSGDTSGMPEELKDIIKEIIKRRMRGGSSEE